RVSPPAGSGRAPADAESSGRRLRAGQRITSSRREGEVRGRRPPRQHAVGGFAGSGPGRNDGPGAARPPPDSSFRALSGSNSLPSGGWHVAAPRGPPRSGPDPRRYAPPRERQIHGGALAGPGRRAVGRDLSKDDNRRRRSGSQGDARGALEGASRSVRR